MGIVDFFKARMNMNLGSPMKFAAEHVAAVPAPAGLSAVKGGGAPLMRRGDLLARMNIPNAAADTAAQFSQQAKPAAASMARGSQGGMRSSRGGVKVKTPGM